MRRRNPIEIEDEIGITISMKIYRAAALAIVGIISRGSSFDRAQNSYLCKLSR